MDIREIAGRAHKEFQSLPLTCYDVLNKAAFLGFLQGVSQGTIVVGQQWAGDILRNVGKGESRVKALTHFMEKDQLSLVQEVFASGMFCDGQVLGTARLKNFAERTVSSIPSA